MKTISSPPVLLFWSCLWSLLAYSLLLPDSGNVGHVPFVARNGEQSLQTGSAYTDNSAQTREANLNEALALHSYGNRYLKRDPSSQTLVREPLPKQQHQATAPGANTKQTKITDYFKPPPKNKITDYFKATSKDKNSAASPPQAEAGRQKNAAATIQSASSAPAPPESQSSISPSAVKLKPRPAGLNKPLPALPKDSAIAPKTATFEDLSKPKHMFAAWGLYMTNRKKYKAWREQQDMLEQTKQTSDLIKSGAVAYADRIQGQYVSSRPNAISYLALKKTEDDEKLSALGVDKATKENQMYYVNQAVGAVGTLSGAVRNLHGRSLYAELLERSWIDGFYDEDDIWL